MSAEGYARFLRQMGHKVRKAEGLFWFDVMPRVYMSFPFQHLVEPRGLDWKSILGSDGWIARFPCEVEFGRKSYRIIADQKDYDLQSLSGKARNQTRRGLENCQVRPTEFEELEGSGIAINRDTLERQGRIIPKGFDDYWRRYFKEASRSEGAHAWGAFVDGVLAAYLIAFRMEGVCHILILRSRRALLRKYPNNALIFSYLKTMLTEEGTSCVSIGFESLQAGLKSLDSFKLGMGFRKEPVGQRIFLKPWLGALIRPAAAGMLARLTALLPQNEKIAKLTGLLKWYSEQPGF